MTNEELYEMYQGGCSLTYIAEVYAKKMNMSYTQAYDCITDIINLALKVGAKV